MNPWRRIQSRLRGAIQQRPKRSTTVPGHIVPVNLAVVGTGVFANRAHLPALRQLGDRFRVVAVVNRSPESARRFALRLPGTVAVYTRLEQALERDDVEAVDLVLPIDALPHAVRTSLEAGKHVFSEKPIAPTLGQAKELIAQYQQRQGLVWMVGENTRYAPSFLRARQLIRQDAMGRPLVCSWSTTWNMGPENPYYKTSWRRSERLPGGLVLDYCVHDMAAIRMLLGEVRRVGAFASLLRPDLGQLDTLSATLELDSGLLLSYLFSFGVGSVAAKGIQGMRLAGEGGLLMANGDHVRLENEHGAERESFAEDGVIDELCAFAEAVRDGRRHRNTPAEALRDLAVMEALLTSARRGSVVEVDRL